VPTDEQPVSYEKGGAGEYDRRASEYHEIRSAAACLDTSENPAFASVQVLIRTLRAYIASWDTDPRPFTWTATTDDILAKVRLTQLNIKKLVANNTK
jgi:hypothetical protein